jgi:hypothetical protein
MPLLGAARAARSHDRAHCVYSCCVNLVRELRSSIVIAALHSLLCFLRETVCGAAAVWAQTPPGSTSLAVQTPDSNSVSTALLNTEYAPCRTGERRPVALFPRPLEAIPYSSIPLNSYESLCCLTRATGLLLSGVFSLYKSCSPSKSALASFCPASIH